jgi:hypothetical protein
MIDNHQAIYDLNPSVSTIRGDEAFDAQGNSVIYDKTAVQAYMDANAYKDKRRLEYPPLTDLADALYHQSKGDETKLTAYLAKCEAVKTKYPKSS